jgi:hypothetical protein
LYTIKTGGEKMDYRKRTFRGAKIEDCILDFELMRKTAEKHSQTSNDNYKKRLYDGMALAYQTVVNRLANDFDYTLEENDMDNLFERWINDFKRMRNSCLEQAKKPLDISNVPEQIKSELNSNKQKGLFEGMATGYNMIVSQLGVLSRLVTDNQNIADIVNQIKAQLNNESEEFAVQSNQEGDDFAKGFYSGLSSSYKSAIAHMTM